MRETKYRAWGPNTKHMWSWEELKNTSVDWLFNEDHGEKIVMQFIGLLDKNGTEIYEGDILVFRSGEIKQTVVYLKDRASFGTIFGGGFDTFEDSMEFCPKSDDGIYDCYEIIGNIHKNPELLS